MEEESDSEAESDDDPVTGSWTGRMISDRIPEDRAEFNFELELDGTKVTGTIEGRRGSQDITEGTYDPETGKISWSIESRRGDREYTGKIEDGKMTGEMAFGGRDFQIEFTASKDDGEPTNTNQLRSFSQVSLQHALTGVLMVTEDPVSGDWAGVIENENLPSGRVEFTLKIKMDSDNQLSGSISSAAGDSEIVEGEFDPETGEVNFEAENDEFNVSVKGEVEGSQMTGSMSLNDGMIEIDFEATKKEAEEDEEEPDTASEKENEQQETKEEPKAENAEEEKQPKSKSEKTESKPESKSDSKASDTQDSPESKEAAKPTESSAAATDNPITGQWEGNMISRNGEREIKLALNAKSNDEITGTLETSQGEREISNGKYDPETKMLTLMADSDRFSFEFSGTVEDDQYEGEIDINEGSFTMDFEVARVSKEGSADKDKAKPEADKSAKASGPAKEYKQPTGEKSLSSLLPGPRWVSSIEASKFKKERCYMTFDGHRSNDDGVYVFVTEDSGKTWNSLTTNLPDTAGSARVLREDTVNENLLFLGCEFSSWFSIDQGKTWTRIKGGLPTVAVHEFAIHSKRKELVAGTHGRSIWVADISVLQQLTPEILAEDMHLFQPRDAISWSRQPGRGNSGTRRFVGTNPSSGTIVAYSLGNSARSVRLTLQDLRGDIIKTFETSARKGYHQINWNLSRDQTGGGGGGRRRFAPSVRPGKYLLTLSVDGEKEQKIIDVIGDPTRPNQTRSAEFEEALFGDQ